MVVLAPCISGHARLGGIVQLRRIGAVDVIERGGHNHRLRRRQHASHVLATTRGAAHVFHIAGVPAVEPLGEKRQLPKVCGGRDAAQIESKLERPLLDGSGIEIDAVIFGCGDNHGIGEPNNRAGPPIIVRASCV